MEPLSKKYFNFLNSRGSLFIGNLVYDFMLGGCGQNDEVKLDIKKYSMVVLEGSQKSGNGKERNFEKITLES